MSEYYDFNKGKAYSQVAAKLEGANLAKKYNIWGQPYEREMTLTFKPIDGHYQLIGEKRGER